MFAAIIYTNMFYQKFLLKQTLKNMKLFKLEALKDT